MSNRFLLAPSMLAADLANLESAVGLCEQGGADLLHVDVMDGHFVPNLTFGIPVMRALKRVTEIPLDVHLMVSNPDALLDDYLDAGADWLSVHWEAATHLDRTLARIRGAGAKAGVALNPGTPVEVLADVLPQADFILLMSVNPGFAGQAFLPYVQAKAERLLSLIADRGVNTLMAMDGGIGMDNIGEVTAAGVTACVAGSAIFGTENPVETMRALRRRAEGE